MKWCVCSALQWSAPLWLCTCEDGTDNVSPNPCPPLARPSRYQASQPWPFPRSLMVGFYASLADQQPSVAGGNGSTAATNSSRSQAYDPTSSSSSSSSSNGSRAGGLSRQQQQEEQALQQLCQLGRSALKEQRMR